jgi:hypothetical protein
MKTVTMIGNPRKTSTYARITALRGKKRIVRSVPRTTPIKVLPTTAVPETRSVAGRPSSRM